MSNIIESCLNDVVSCLSSLNHEQYIQPSLDCIAMTAETLKNGGAIFFCGNGGSASTASHLANDLSCHMKNWNREGYKCICINDSTSIITSLTNDYGFECIFSRQVENLGKAGDIIWAFSTSGNSKNVVRAVESAKKMGIKTVAFTGRGGGKLKDLCDLWVPCNSDEVTRVEELHMIYGHSIALGVEAVVSPME